MLGIISFIVSIVAVIMSFFPNLILAAFAIAIMGIIIAVISAYDKDTTDKEKQVKTSRAFEVGSIIIAAAAALSYYIFAIIAQL
mgnify:FL=1